MKTKHYKVLFSFLFYILLLAYLLFSPYLVYPGLNGLLSSSLQYSKFSGSGEQRDGIHYP